MSVSKGHKMAIGATLLVAVNTFTAGALLVDGAELIDAHSELSDSHAQLSLALSM